MGEKRQKKRYQEDEVEVSEEPILLNKKNRERKKRGGGKLECKRTLLHRLEDLFGKLVRMSGNRSKQAWKASGRGGRTEKGAEVGKNSRATMSIQGKREERELKAFHKGKIWASKFDSGRKGVR